MGTAAHSPDVEVDASVWASVGSLWYQFFASWVSNWRVCSVAGLQGQS